MPGTLFVVATPIGNLEDLTFRALRTLREVDLVAAEDTRRTAKLLSHYEIRRPLTSLREHNEAREAPRLVERLARGESIALVTDAGTPGIADPGARFVSLVRDRGFRIVPIPGPSAVAAAWSVSGVPGAEFVFLGFPPASGSARNEWFDRLAVEPRAIVFFEAPHRIRRTVAELRSLLGERPIIIHRELSKIHEHSVVSHKLSDPVDLPERGEFTIVAFPKEARENKSPNEALIVSLFGSMVSQLGLDRETALGLVSKAAEVPTRVVVKILKKARYSGI